MPLIVATNLAFDVVGGNLIMKSGGLLVACGGQIKRFLGFSDEAALGNVPKGIDLMDQVGQLGGILFPADRILTLAKYLDRRGIYLHEAVNGSFDGVRGVMTLPRNATKLNVRHELSHMLDYRKYGDDYYKLFTPAQCEQMVLERLKNNRI